MKNIKRKIEDLINKESIIVVCDFDYTITTKNSNSSIAVFSNYLPECCPAFRNNAAWKYP